MLVNLGLDVVKVLLGRLLCPSDSSYVPLPVRRPIAVQAVFVDTRIGRSDEEADGTAKRSIRETPCNNDMSAGIFKPYLLAVGEDDGKMGGKLTVMTLVRRDIDTGRWRVFSVVVTTG
jgi:hypothetical protein